MPYFLSPSAVAALSEALEASAAVVVVENLRLASLNDGDETTSSTGPGDETDSATEPVTVEFTGVMDTLGPRFSVSVFLPYFSPPIY